MKKLSRYDLVAVVAQGKLGPIWEGHDPDIRRKVTIKVAPVEHLSAQAAEAMAARFRTEARVAGKLVHPNIVGVYDAGVDAGLAYIVTETVAGATLDAMLRQPGGVPPDMAGRIALQILAALDHAHGKNVAHLGLQPTQVTVTQTGAVKVSDFGAAENTEEDDSTRSQGSLTENIRCLAPEQALGLPADARADVWAVGVLLYRLWSGRWPFDDSSDFGLIQRIAKHVPAAPSTLAPGLSPAHDRVVERALAKAAADRYQSAREFAADLTRLGLAQPAAGPSSVTPSMPMTPTMPVVPVVPVVPFPPAVPSAVAAEQASVDEDVTRIIPAARPAAESPEAAPITPPPAPAPLPPPSLPASRPLSPPPTVDIALAAAGSAAGGERRKGLVAVVVVALALAAALATWFSMRDKAAPAASTATAPAAPAATAASAATAAASATPTAEAPANAVDRPVGTAPLADVPAPAPLKTTVAPRNKPPAATAGARATAAVSPTRRAAEAEPAQAPRAKSENADPAPAAAKATATPRPSDAPAGADKQAATTDPCGKRVLLARVFCMKEECAKAEWARNPQCIEWKQLEESNRQRGDRY